MSRSHLNELLELGHTLSNLKKYEEAALCFSTAQSLDPDNYIISFNLGSTLLNAEKYPAAAEVYRQTITLNPNFAPAYAKLGIALRGQGKNAEAIKAYDKSLALENNPETSRNKAIAVLATGNLKEGFNLYEERLKIEGRQLLYKWYAGEKPYWQGEIFSGKRLLVHHEQGLGDSLQYVRYLKKVKERGGLVIFSAPKALLPLYETFAANGAIDILVEHNYQAITATNYDLVIPLISLPYIFGTTLKTIPADIPYISADPALSLIWRDKILKTERGSINFKVGLVWSAGNVGSDTAVRTSGLASMAPLAEIQFVSYYSIQLGQPAQKIRDFSNNTGMRLFDLTGSINNFADTAAFLDNLDLIITVDTSVAHLAGALGKPVFLMLNYSTNWTWFTKRCDSPWYPTMRLFRQPSPGDWANVINQVKLNLLSLVNSSKI